MLAALAGANTLTSKKATTTALSTFEDKIAAFGEVLMATENGLVVAGKLLVEMCNENPDTMDLLLQRYPNLSLGFLTALERVGLGKLDARVLFLGDKPVANRIAALPPQMQARLFNNPIPVVVDAGGRVENLHLNEMTNQEKLRAIGPEGIRKPKEQVSLIQAPQPKPRFEYWAGNKVYFNSRGPYSLKELAGIVEQLTKMEKTTLQENIKRNQIL